MATYPGYVCATCGAYHAELPLCYGTPAPDLWEQLSAAEQAERGELTPDLCVIDQASFFVRGNLEIPIQGDRELFTYSIWVSLSEVNFARTRALWNDEARAHEPPYFGWFSTSLPGYPETLNLKTLVHTRAVGLVPWIELEPTDHPLAVEQRTGITRERIREIAELLCSTGARMSENAGTDE
jgi:hypothetical protein